MLNIINTKNSKRNLILGLAFLAFFSLIPAPSLFAAPVTGFNAGKIIDDGIFTNSGSMTPGQIQAFLSSKVPNCDTWGTKPSEFGGGTRAQWAAARGITTPFTCLKDYSENGKSSSQLIYDVAQQYRINPQILIVLLQKEQALVTDEWPMPSQYRSATGYGCPDTAACDSQYYGLTNQLQWSARMFRSIMDANPNWYTPYVLGDNYVRWNPAVSCGGSTVNIQNRATQALYNYTPYQPNQAALNAGYGNGDSCSAYGNRNFYLYFTDWFGNVRYMFGNKASSDSLYARTACTIPDYSTDNIGRLYNPDTRDFLYTLSHNEACGAVRYGYIWDGIVMKNATGTASIPVYRISNAERHIYTSSSSVRTNYLNNFGYKDEGIGFYVYGSNAPGRTPVSGLQKDETFFITSSGREAIYYQDAYGFYNFGTMYYTDSIATQTSVYRITRNNSRLYTTSALERDNALKFYGYADEGTISTNDTAPNDANMPVYRIRDGINGGYVYTSSRIERDTAVVNYGYISEGSSFYSLMYSPRPVYRATNARNLMRIYTSSDYEYRNAASVYGYALEGIGWYSY
jgi:hypothetical protein